MNAERKLTFLKIKLMQNTIYDLMKLYYNACIHNF